MNPAPTVLFAGEGFVPSPGMSSVDPLGHIFRAHATYRKGTRANEGSPLGADAFCSDNGAEKERCAPWAHHDFRQRGRAMKASEKVETIVWCVLVVLMLPIGVAAQDEVFEDSFDPGIGIRPQHWSLWTNQPNFVVDDAGGDVYFHNPYGGIGRGYFEDISLCFKDRLSGDFDVSVSFSDLQLDPTPAGCNEAGLGVGFGNQYIGLTRQNCADSEIGQTIGVWMGPPDEWQEVQASNASSGVLRIARIGKSVTASLNDLPVLSGDYNSEQVTSVCFRLATWGSEGIVSAHFDDFSATAAVIEYPTAQWRISAATTTLNNGSGITALGVHTHTGTEVTEAAIAYSDPDTDELRVVRGTPDGPVWSWAPPEVAAAEGNAPDLVYDDCGDLWLSYLKGSRKKLTLNLAHWDSVDQTWSSREVESGVRRWAASLANRPGTCGSPSITYGIDAGSRGELRFVEGTASPVTVDSGAAREGRFQSGVGSFSSLTWSGGEPAVAYSYLDQDGRTSVKFASRSTGAWLPEHVFDHGIKGIREMDLAFQGGSPALAFTDAHDAPLYYCGQSPGWQCEMLNVGRFCNGPSVVVDDQETVIVSAEKWDSLNVYRQPLDANEWHVEGIGGITKGADSALDPNGNPVFSFWSGPGLGLAFLHTGSCEVGKDYQCDDANPCTIDSCPAGTCQHEFLGDNTVCGGPGDRCCAGFCLNRDDVVANCDDGDECTKDFYEPGGNPPCSAYCTHEFDPNVPGCGGECISTHSKEKGPRCSDGLDNDCDGLIDGEDPDC